jgi:hypothetical protein
LKNSRFKEKYKLTEYLPGKYDNINKCIEFEPIEIITYFEMKGNEFNNLNLIGLKHKVTKI